MDWETLVQDLNEQQLYLRRIVAASKEQQEAERPGSDFSGLLSADPGVLLPMVKTHHAHPNMPLAAMANAQIKFNQTVISMLTDLDTRKSEPNT